MNNTKVHGLASKPETVVDYRRSQRQALARGVTYNRSQAAQAKTAWSRHLYEQRAEVMARGVARVDAIIASL